MLNSPSEGSRIKGNSSKEKEPKQSPVPKLRLGNLTDDKSTPSQGHHNAAVVIQRWFRGWNVRRKVGKFAVKQLLGQRKQAVERQSFNYLGSKVR